MKKCPACSIPLTQVDYEGLPVMTCPDCGGHLMKQDRMQVLLRLDRIPKEQLLEEASAFKGSTEERIPCPDCTWLMRKEPLHRLIKQFTLDYCNRCGWVWLDPGELAIAQWAHQTTAAFRDAQDLRQRMEELESSPERMAAFEAALRELPDDKGALEGLAGELLEEALIQAVLHASGAARGYGIHRSREKPR